MKLKDLLKTTIYIECEEVNFCTNGAYAYEGDFDNIPKEALDMDVASITLDAGEEHIDIVVELR